MHLAYIDDSGASNRCAMALYGALIIEDRWVASIEGLMALTAANLLPPDRRDDFHEFHAFELFKGKGIFEGISEPKRFRAIDLLLSYVSSHALRFVYAAVDRSLFRSRPVDSITPLTFAFRMCLLGVEEFEREEATRRHLEKQPGVDRPLAMYFVDDVTDETRKRPMKSEYRSLRQQKAANPSADARLWYAHDALCFADSSESVGLQMADLCAFFTLGRLQKRLDQDMFFDKFKSLAVCAKPMPEWGQYDHLLLEHV